MTKYYEATDPALVTQLNRMLEDDVEQRQAAHALADQYGADGILIGTGMLSSDVIGFVFKDEDKVDRKVFKRFRNNNPDGENWLPRRNTKAGRELDKQLRSIRLFSVSEVARLIGMGTIRGDVVRTPGIADLGGRIILAVPGDVTPDGCTRISDVDVERLREENGKKP